MTLKLTHGTREIRDFDVSLVLRSVPLAVPGTCRRPVVSASNLKPQAKPGPAKSWLPSEQRVAPGPQTQAASFEARPGPRQRTRWSGAVHLPMHLPLPGGCLWLGCFCSHLAGRPCNSQEAAHSECLLAFGLPQRGQLHSVSGSERHARVRQVAGCSTSSTRPAGRWQLGTQRQHNTRCQCSPQPEAL